MITLEALEKAAKSVGAVAVVFDMKAINGKVSARYMKKDGSWSPAQIAEDNFEDAVAALFGTRVKRGDTKSAVELDELLG